MSLDDKIIYCSTTKLLTKDKPTLEQKPEYKLEQKLFLSPNSERKGEGGIRTKGLFKKSYENKPLISIVTVVYNGEKYLEQTINSVLDQDYDNVEYIVIDGSSTDGTLDIIKKYEEKIDYWVSESDGGIYNAMNKGISLCLGEYIAFLNADDWYETHAIKTVVSASSIDAFDCIYGDANTYKKNLFIKCIYGDLTKYRRSTPICHQSLFITSYQLRLFPFDKRYPILADYDMMVRCIEKKFKFHYINEPLSNFRLNGVSSSENINYEFFKIQNKYFGFIHAGYWYLVRLDYFVINLPLKVISKIVLYFRKNK